MITAAWIRETLGYALRHHESKANHERVKEIKELLALDDTALEQAYETDIRTRIHRGLTGE